MNQVKGALQDELDAYLDYTGQHDSAQETVSKAAFCKARRQLKASAFVELRDEINQDFYASSHVKTWWGFRLCAVDCSQLTLPRTDAILDHFGGRKNKYARIPQATLSQCYDPLNGFTLDATLGSSHPCERTLALDHLKKITGKNLFLYDRGYPGYWFYQAHTHYKHHFCMRMTTTTPCNYVRDFLSDDATDKTLIINATEKGKRICEDKDYPSEPLRVRMIKVFLPSGEVEVLITNLLDKTQYPESEFSALYFKRWGVEEDFKQQKHTLVIERFSGKSIIAIEQDIAAKILTKNIARLIALGASAPLADINNRRQLTYQVNFKQLLSKCKHTLAKALIDGWVTPWITRLIDSAIRYVEPVREGRKYPRKRLVGTRSATHGTYKRTR